MNNNNTTQTVSQIDYYECECSEDKKYQLVFDGADTGQYAVVYCQKCFDSDDKQFMVSMEELS